MEILIIVGNVRGGCGSYLLLIFGRSSSLTEDAIKVRFTAGRQVLP